MQPRARSNASRFARSVCSSTWLLSAPARPTRVRRLSGSRKAPDYIGQVIKGFQGTDTGLGIPKAAEPQAAARLQNINQLYTDLGTAVRSAVNAAPALPAAQNAAQSVTDDARGLAITAARTAPTTDAGAIALLPVALAAAVLLVVLMLWFGIRGLRDTVDRHRLALETQRKETDRNQQAILRLLDELSSLADGDLTVQATVTEDITGAIADSINYAVDALRGLVTTINQSAIHLDSAARQTQALSAHLAKASGAPSSRLHRQRDRPVAWPLRRKKCPATQSARQTSRGTRWKWRTRAATPCVEPSTA